MGDVNKMDIVRLFFGYTGWCSYVTEGPRDASSQLKILLISFYATMTVDNDSL